MLQTVSNFWRNNNVPVTPGCYLYYDQSKTIIYIGKAKNLRVRMRQYFTNTRHPYRIHKLVSEIKFYDFYTTNNEKEALILEQTLIKKHKPKYNLLLTDDKSYPYLIITKEPNPRYQLTRDRKALSYYRCYGPFPDGAKAYQFFHFLQQNLPLARCSSKQNECKPCFYAQINQCLGPCYRKVNFSEYGKVMNLLDKFFKGERKLLYEIIDHKIQKTAANLQFEEAIKYRDLKQKLA